jgi:hypothetical protein
MKTGLLEMIAVAGFLVPFSGTGMASGENETEETLFEEVLRSYEMRERQLDPAWVRYELAYVEAPDRRSRGQHYRGGKDMRWTEEAEYARRGGKIKSVVRGQHPNIPLEKQDLFRIWNGEIAIWASPEKDPITQQPVFFLSRNNKKPTLSEVPLGIVGEMLVRNALHASSKRRRPISARFVRGAGEDKAGVLADITFSDTQ